MLNKPKCAFCKAVLNADNINILKRVNSCFSLGNIHPIQVPMNDEIVIHVTCPKCGATGEALGDKTNIIYKSPNITIEVNHVYLGAMSIGNQVNIVFNPTRRDHK